MRVTSHYVKKNQNPFSFRAMVYTSMFRPRHLLTDLFLKQHRSIFKIKIEKKPCIIFFEPPWYEYEDEYAHSNGWVTPGWVVCLVVELLRVARDTNVLHLGVGLGEDPSTRCKWWEPWHRKKNKKINKGRRRTDEKNRRLSAERFKEKGSGFVIRFEEVDDVFVVRKKIASIYVLVFVGFAYL